MRTLNIECGYSPTFDFLESLGKAHSFPRTKRSVGVDSILAQLLPSRQEDCSLYVFIGRSYGCSFVTDFVLGQHDIDQASTRLHYRVPSPFAPDIAFNVVLSPSPWGSDTPGLASSIVRWKLVHARKENTGVSG